MSQHDSQSQPNQQTAQSAERPDLSAEDQEIIRRALARIEELRGVKPVSDALVKRVESELGVNERPAQGQK